MVRIVTPHPSVAMGQLNDRIVKILYNFYYGIIPVRRIIE